MVHIKMNLKKVPFPSHFFLKNLQSQKNDLASEKFPKSPVNVGSYSSTMGGQIYPKLISER